MKINEARAGAEYSGKNENVKDYRKSYILRIFEAFPGFDQT